MVLVIAPVGAMGVGTFVMVKAFAGLKAFQVLAVIARAFQV